MGDVKMSPILIFIVMISILNKRSDCHPNWCKDNIKLMKDGVFLVNTSRGALVDTNAVKDALLSGKISNLAIDVYEQEEQLFFHDLSSNIINDALILELMMYPNVLITAHQGFFTKEALSQIAQTTLTNIYNFTLGKISNEVLVLNNLLS